MMQRGGIDPNKLQAIVANFSIPKMKLK